MAASTNAPLTSTEQTLNAPMAFRRERNWFLSFVMAPFKDVDQRATEEYLARRHRPAARQ